MVSWKLPAGFAGFAIIISLLTGLISGVAFGDALLRAVFWAAFFALLGFGFGVAVNKFFPELLEKTNSSEAEDEDAQSEEGEEVDITLPDENPHAQTSAREGSRAAAGVVGDTEDLEADEEFGTLADSGTSDGADKKTSGQKREEKLDNLEGMDDPFIEADDIDSLPDLEKFSGSFSSFDDFESSSPGSEGGSFGAKESVEIGGITQDPAKVAKALHTWIERDKEG